MGKPRQRAVDILGFQRQSGRCRGRASGRTRQESIMMRRPVETTKRAAARRIKRESPVDDREDQRDHTGHPRWRSAGIYLIVVSAAISSLPSAVLIVSRTWPPLPPAGIVAEMRLLFFGSAFTASSNNTASPRFNVTRNGAAGSILKN